MKVGRKLVWSARSWWWLAVLAYSFSLMLFAVWSFSLTDPNLVFTSWTPYWQTQVWLWQNIYADPILQARLYVLIVSIVMTSYGLLIWKSRCFELSRHHSGLTCPSSGGNSKSSVSALSSDTRHPELTSSPQLERRPEHIEVSAEAVVLGSANSGFNQHFEMQDSCLTRDKQVQPNISRQRKQLSTFNRYLILALAIILLPLLFSYNALSHDVFNYLFNAKMVVVYQANPHIQVALDFAQDNWTRFMHNTHTPAPYWYGWTGISLIPFSLGLGKFTLTWWLFRLFSVLSWMGLWWSWYKWGQWRGYRVTTYWMLAIALLPLMLIEVIVNGHNDLWMMVPAILSLGMILYRKLSWSTLLGSIALLAFSISIKYVTVVLLPLWLLIFISRLMSERSRHSRLNPESSKRGVNQLTWRLAPLTQLVIQLSPLIASILLFTPLLTSRSQQFLPWYLTWSLVWTPLFVRKIQLPPVNRQITQPNFHRLIAFISVLTKLWIAWLIALSISALFRYIPWLLAGGEYSVDLLLQQKLILWGGGVFMLLSYILYDYTA